MKKPNQSMSTIKLHETENACCSRQENLKPIFVIFEEDGFYQTAITHFCEKCGWISVKQLYGNNIKTEIDGVFKQELFDNLTAKVEYICFTGKNPDLALTELTGKTLLLFKNQRIKKVK